MAGWIARQILRKYNKSSSKESSKNILILGACFKENCPDIRNSQAINLADTLNDYGFNIEISDYVAYKFGILNSGEFNISNYPESSKKYSIIICAVSHSEYKKWSVSDWENLKESKSSLLVDVKNIIPRELSPMRF